MDSTSKKKIAKAQKAAQRALKHLKTLTTLMWNLTPEESSQLKDFAPTIPLRLDTACDLVDSLEWSLWSATKKQENVKD